VRYLLSRDEEKQYRSRATDEERARFIEDFWARRDEDPSTPANEFEIRFWNRVAEAEQKFQDAPFPGWKTDRGKLHILLGAPDEIRQGMATGPRGKDIPYVIWIYHQPRFEGMDRDTEIRFVRRDSGELAMTDQLFMNRLEMISGAASRLASGAAIAQKAPEPRQILDAIASSKPPMDAGRFHTHYDFFLAADGSTSVVLTLGIRHATLVAPAGGAPAPAPAPGSWKVFARISNGVSSYDLVEAESFRTAEIADNVDGFHLYQGRISAPPGVYTVFYAIQNPDTGELFSLGDRLQVPTFAGTEFALSGITLAARLESGGNRGAGAPFLVGRMTVVPKMEPVFKVGDDLAFYFQVYHPRPDPSTGAASLDLTYQFFQAEALKKTGEPEFTPLGKPVVSENQTGQVHGYTFALAGWPAGEYKLRVTVRDRVTDRAVESESRFSVN
jgi:GWxTD domain-containing protein